MSIVLIRRAIETKLAAITPALPTAWENAPFTPAAGAPYQRVYLLPAEPENPEWGAMRRETGTLQISLCYPLGTGTREVADRAELIRSHFVRGTSAVADSATVQFFRTPMISAAIIDADRYVLPVRIRYFANLTA